VHFCVFYLPTASYFILFFCVFGVFSLGLFCIVSTSASDGLVRLISKVTCYVSSGT